MRIFIGFLACLLTTMGYTLPVGNPAAPKIIEEGFFLSPGKWWGVRMGYEGSFVIDGKFKHTEGSDIDSWKQNFQMGSLTLNFQNRCDIYGLVGASNMKARWRLEEALHVYSLYEMETHYDFSWQTGIKGILFEWGCVSLEAGGRYMHSKADLLFLTRNGSPISSDDNYAIMKGWQVDLGLSYKIDMYVPYIAGKYSRMKGKIVSKEDISSSGTTLSGLENENNYGMAIGCSLSSGKIFMLNFEARLFDEEAVTISGEIKF